MVVTNSIYSKKFYSNQLTEQKYNELEETAVMLRDKRNELSKYLCQHLEQYLEYNKFKFITEMRTKGLDIPSSYDKHLFEDVFVMFENKFESIKRRLKFQNIQYEGIELYKRDTKEHKKGSFKKVRNKHTETKLSIALSYLCKYGNTNIVEYIKSQLDKDNPKLLALHTTVLEEIEKFGFGRLFKLAKSKRDRIFNYYAEHPVEFKSLTFRGRSRKKIIIGYNKNYASEINAFVSLSGFGRSSMDIPVKFNKDYHGSIHDYEKKTNDYEYTVTFDEHKKRVCVILTKKQDRYIPDAGTNLIGIDVNAKHNMFTLSDGSTFDYDRDLLKAFTELSKYTDELKKKDKDYKVGKRKQRKLDVLRHKMHETEKQTIAVMCKSLKEQGVDHVAMEDLNGTFGKCYVKDKVNDDVNYNRITGFLGISSLKDEIEHIARKYDIAVSTVHASYTSKMCPICGCIEDENRPNQETFQCVECGHEDNADVNAAINIRNRVGEAVLAEKLLTKLDNGAYKPKKLEREKVKETLLSYRTNLRKKAGNDGKHYDS